MSISSCPAILIAAPASGQGKTTVVSALARLHTRQGRRVRVFKCGPDFLDPVWHELASGAPVYQIDLWMTGEDDIRTRLAAAAREADLILVEGVMGLFDGTPSAADLARRFGLPVLAVIDAGAMAGTFGALAFGLQHYQAGLPWAGVLANRVASERHADMLRSSVREPALWLGAVMRNPAMSLPERHLGLTLASEVSDALARLDAAADMLAATPLGQMSLADLQRWDVSFSDENDSDAGVGACAGHGSKKGQGNALPSSQALAGRTVAIARDAAFCFIYTANLDCLKELGAELVFFSPLADPELPACDAVWLPGGYPELHAKALAANVSMRKSLAAHVARQQPVWAECGGMMVLFDNLVAVDGEACAQWGLLPGTVTLQKRLVGLGPQQLATKHGTLRGHTFHYSSCATALPVPMRTSPPGAAPSPDAGEALYQVGAIRASYFHAWFASSPAATAALFSADSNLVPEAGGGAHD